MDSSEKLLIITSNSALFCLGLTLILSIPGFISKLCGGQTGSMKFFDNSCTVILGLMAFLFFMADIEFIRSSFKNGHYFPLITAVTATAMIAVFANSTKIPGKSYYELYLNYYPRETVTAILLTEITLPLCHQFNQPELGAYNAEYLAELILIGLEIYCFYILTVRINCEANIQIEDDEQIRKDLLALEEKFQESYRSRFEQTPEPVYPKTQRRTNTNSAPKTGSSYQFSMSDMNRYSDFTVISANQQITAADNKDSIN